MSGKYEEARKAAMRAGWNDHARNENGTLDTSINAALDAFLSKLSETHAIVPKVATEHMLKAGFPAVQSLEASDDYDIGPALREVWAAMITAAEKK